MRPISPRSLAPNCYWSMPCPRYRSYSPQASSFMKASTKPRCTRTRSEKLQKLAEELEKDGLQVRWEVGIANDVGMEILRIAEHNHADLIVIATHGMTGWHEMVFGSVAEKVVRLATCPVLVLRVERKAENEKPTEKSNSAVA